MPWAVTGSLAYPASPASAQPGPYSSGTCSAPLAHDPGFLPPAVEQAAEGGGDLAQVAALQVLFRLGRLGLQPAARTSVRSSLVGIMPKPRPGRICHSAPVAGTPDQ